MMSGGIGIGGAQAALGALPASMAGSFDSSITNGANFSSFNISQQ